MIRKKKWRANPEIVNALRETAKKFEGTHNFHNFTVGRDYKERSCNRYMKKIEVKFAPLNILMDRTADYDRSPTLWSMERRSGYPSCYMGRVLCYIRYISYNETSSVANNTLDCRCLRSLLWTMLKIGIA